MRRTKLACALIWAGTLAAGFSAAVMPAAVGQPDSPAASSAAPITAETVPTEPAAVPATEGAAPEAPAAEPEPEPRSTEEIGGPGAEERPSPRRDRKRARTRRPAREKDAKPGRPRAKSRKGKRRAARRGARRPKPRRQLDRRRPVRAPVRDRGGRPTIDNPGISLAAPGPAPIGVPNFFIDKFRIPPFLLPIYQAAGIQYGIRWEVLAAINEIETDYGRNLNVSSAGALGWMQFMPPTWKAYGVDANRDGRKDPYNPVDAIFAAARYLRAAGGERNLRKALFAYNHADWYVNSVLLRARVIGGLPADLVGSLSGLTQGHFPVPAKARYADDLSEREARRGRTGRSAARVVEGDDARRGIAIFARRGAPVVAVNDAVVKRIGTSRRLGRYVVIQDVYGNRYTYGRLAKVASHHAAPKEREVSRAQVARELELPRDPQPTRPASVSRGPRRADGASRRPATGRAAPRAAGRRATSPAAGRPARTRVAKERLFANPSRPGARRAGGDEQRRLAAATGSPRPGARGLTGKDAFSAYFSREMRLRRDDFELRRLRVGSRVIAGTVLGRIGRTGSGAPAVQFEIRPAGRGAPRIDPKPILDGWKLLESTAIYRAAGRNPFFGPDAKNPSIGQILLMSKEALERRVVANPRIHMYDCGRRDVRGGQIDRRVLATLEFLAGSGLRPTVTSLRCGRASSLTASGNLSHHASGNAVDIAAVNGIPVLGNQGRGSITDTAVRRLLTLQGTMQPAQIITLMKYDGAPNTLAMADHHDHIHVGFHPRFGTDRRLGRQMDAVLRPRQWIKLVDRLSRIDNPVVRRKPSRHAIKVGRASRAHRGE